jgi:GGDEF domain-containing protein
VIRAASSESAGLRPPRVLVIGDEDGQVAAALGEAEPGLSAISVSNVFDGIAQLHQEEFGALLVNVKPLEHRPEAALKSLRQRLDASPSRRPSRVILFGPTGFEPLAREARAWGADDYLLLPARARDVREALLPPRPAEAAEAASFSLIPDDIPLAAIVLDGLMSVPGAALAAAVNRINTYLPTAVRLELAAEAPASTEGLVAPLPQSDGAGKPAPVLVLHVPAAADQADRDMAQHDLQGLAVELAKLAELDERYAQLQRLALADDLTGCYNRRYFRHFLDKILAKARSARFPVTLLLFDIDDFKHYNDRHGHRVGDAILRQTAELIKRCVRDHDLVARIGGDEFAVIFWEKDAPRVPHDPATASGGRFPVGPLQIANRFRRLMAEPDFFALGSTGQGSLSISGGMAVFPFDAQSADELVEAADRALVFGSKRSGKNSISLVGDDPERNEHRALGAEEQAM